MTDRQKILTVRLSDVDWSLLDKIAQTRLQPCSMQHGYRFIGAGLRLDRTQTLSIETRDRHRASGLAMKLRPNTKRHLSAWYHWQKVMERFESDVSEFGARRFWAKNGIDIMDDDYEPLRCLLHFSRQLYVAMKSLLSGARLRLNG